jgi:hypothetical protein
MAKYDRSFYDYLQSFAVASAERVVPIVSSALPVRNIVDFGCGQGAWLSVWAEKGAEIHGLDGDYVDRAGLLIPATSFQPADLARPIQLERRFDLAQSLEVAEHLPSDRAEAFVSTLVAHAPCVLFSAAVPGQGGMHHVNERPLEYWRGLFRRHGYVAVDCIRPAIRNDAAVQPWYRCNTLLYVEAQHLDTLSVAARALVIPDGCPISNYWPASQRFRQLLLRPLPVAVMDALARLSALRFTRLRDAG